MEATDVERAAAQTERFLSVQLHRHGGEPVHFEALFDAAGQIAEHLGVLCNIQRDAVLTQGGPEPPNVAEQILALPSGAEETERPERRGRVWRRRGAEGRLDEMLHGARDGIEQARKVRRDGPGASRRLLRLVRKGGGRPNGYGRDRVRMGCAGEPSHRETKAAPDRGPAARTDWTMKRAQSRTPASRQSSGIWPRDPAMSMTLRRGSDLSKTVGWQRDEARTPDRRLGSNRGAAGSRTTLGAPSP